MVDLTISRRRGGPRARRGPLGPPLSVGGGPVDRRRRQRRRGRAVCV